MSLKRTGFSISEVSATFIIMASTVALAFLLKWILHDVQATADKISGMTLAVTVGGGISASVLGIFQKLLEKEAKTIEVSLKREWEIKESEKVKELENRIFIERLEPVLRVIRETGIQLTDEHINSLLTPQQKIQADSFKERAREYEEYFDVRQEVVRHLVANEKLLKSLAKEACNITLNKLRQTQLERLGLTTELSRRPFYEDIFLYLNGWLKNSIMYDQPMPEEIGRAITDSQLYVDILTFLRDERLKWFSLPNDESEKVVKKYLNILIQKLK